MTLVASLLFLSALVVSAFAIAVTIGNAAVRIREVIDAEFAPEVKIQRRINFGPVRHSGASSSANVVAFPSITRDDWDLRLAA